MHRKALEGHRHWTKTCISPREVHEIAPNPPQIPAPHTNVCTSCTRCSPHTLPARKCCYECMCRVMHPHTLTKSAPTHNQSKNKEKNKYNKKSKKLKLNRIKYLQKIEKISIKSNKFISFLLLNFDILYDGFRVRARR